jgi:hypothetical protein
MEWGRRGAEWDRPGTYETDRTHATLDEIPGRYWRTTPFRCLIAPPQSIRSPPARPHRSQPASSAQSPASTVRLPGKCNWTPERISFMVTDQVVNDNYISLLGKVVDAGEPGSSSLIRSPGPSHPSTRSHSSQGSPITLGESPTLDPSHRSHRSHPSRSLSIARKGSTTSPSPMSGTVSPTLSRLSQ